MNKTVDQFLTLFSRSPDLIVASPGRINLIGEHTDYNLGYVLPAAIDKGFFFAFGRRDDLSCRIHALDLDDMCSFELTRFEKSDKNWVVLIQGVLDQCIRSNLMPAGFDCVFSSSIPIGSGLSSSTALDCGILKGMVALNDWQLDRWDLVNLSNRANNEYLGVQGGILDQFAIVFGKKDHSMLLDCRSRKYQYQSFTHDEIEWVVVDSGVRHNHLESGYNDRASECAQLVELVNRKYEEVKSLRDLTGHMLDDMAVKIPGALSRRGRFIISENQRVLDFVEAMKNADFQLMGALLKQSHLGLKNGYEVSCFEMDTLVSLADSHKDVYGARMVGGGFGGCIIILVKKRSTLDLIRMIEEKYERITGIRPNCFSISFGHGLRIIDKH